MVKLKSDFALQNETHISHMFFMSSLVKNECDISCMSFLTLIMKSFQLTVMLIDISFQHLDNVTSVR